MKVLIILCTVAFAKGGIIRTDYSPATSVSSVYSSINQPVITKSYTPVVAKTFAPTITYTKTYNPYYNGISATHQSTTNNLDGSRHDTLIKSVETPFATVNKYDSHTSSNTVYHSVPSYSLGTPVVHSLSHPVTYTTHSAHAPVYTKTIAAPAVAISTPVKTITPGLSAYSSHTPVVAAHPVKITYSEAPLVSHTTFTGLGTSYSW